MYDPWGFPSGKLQIGYKSVCYFVGDSNETDDSVEIVPPISSDNSVEIVPPVSDMPDHNQSAESIHTTLGEVQGGGPCRWGGGGTNGVST